MEDAAGVREQRPLAWLRLMRAPGVGARTASRLLDRFGSAQAVCAASQDELRGLGLRDSAVAFLRDRGASGLEEDLAWLALPRNHLVTLDHPAYPALLKEIADPPPILYVHGNPEVLGSPQIAVVGSRNPTSGGAQTARAFAAHLAGSGVTITSGLALGIDAAAHEGALTEGLSIAVMGTGLDRVYPARHRALAHRIAEQGVLVSEFPPGTPPQPGNFPRRNRIISGLSVGTLVVEAARQSGSLITARLASEQGREVFAIPGSIHNPLARGCHQLIRQGAKLVETAQDIIEEAAPLLGTFLRPPPLMNHEEEEIASLDEEYRAVLKEMGFDPVTPDALIARTGFSAEAISSMLLLLELKGYVSSAPGGRYSRTEKIPTS